PTPVAPVAAMATSPAAMAPTQAKRSRVGSRGRQGGHQHYAIHGPCLLQKRVHSRRWETSLPARPNLPIAQLEDSGVNSKNAQYDRQLKSGKLASQEGVGSRNKRNCGGFCHNVKGSDDKLPTCQVAKFAATRSLLPAALAEDDRGYVTPDTGQEECREQVPHHRPNAAHHDFVQHARAVVLQSHEAEGGNAEVLGN